MLKRESATFLSRMGLHHRDKFKTRIQIASGPTLIERRAQGSVVRERHAGGIRRGEAPSCSFATPLAAPAAAVNIGMDSLMAIELKSRLERAVAAPLPSALAFNYPSVNALVDFLDTTIAGFTPACAVELEDADEILSRLPDMSAAEVKLTVG